MDINAILLALGVLGALGIIFGVVLGVADKKFAVKTDPRVEANMDVVRWAIHTSVQVNEQCYGFGYDDLFQWIILL